MRYVKLYAENSNHGNPMGQSFDGCVTLPDELLSAYLDCKGFAILAIDGNAVTAVEPNQEALDAYLAEHPEIEVEEGAPTELEQLRSDVDFIAMETGIEL